MTAPDLDEPARSGSRTFSAAAFWPRHRIRRPLDIPRLIVAAAVLVTLVVLALTDDAFLGWVTDLGPQVRPGVARTVLSLANVAASLAVAGALVAVVVDALRSHPFAFSVALLAGAGAVLGGFAVVMAVDLAAGPATATALSGPDSYTSFMPVSFAFAAVIGADLPRCRLRRMAYLATVVATGCAVALGGLTVLSATFGAAAAATVALGLRVGVGVVPARPSDDLVATVLARAGLSLTGLRSMGMGAGWGRYVGTDADGRPLSISVVDRDLRGTPLARRAWRLLRLRTSAVGRPALSLRRQLERQALSASLADAAGVAVPRVVALLAVGQALMLVERPLTGTRIDDVPAQQVPAAGAAAARALRRLHDAGLSHGLLTVHGIVLLDDGQAGFTNLLSAQPAATDLQRELDVVALLVALATTMTADEAVAICRSAYGSTPESEVRFAALLQPVALPRSASRAARHTSRIKDLRAALTHHDPDTAAVAPTRVERLRTRTVVSIVGGAAAAYILVGQLSKVSLASALHPAAPAWLGAALAGSAVTYLGSALAKQAFMPTSLPLGRTTLVQLASSFLTLVTPPSVGHIGINIRYFQRAGVATATAAASVAVSEAVTVIVTVALVLVCGWLTGASSTQISLLPSGTVVTVLLGAAALVAAVAAFGPSRRLIRRRLQPLLRRTLPQMIATASDPRRLATATLGAVILNAGYVVALDASLRAFGTSVALPVLVVVYFASSAVAAAAPTPGGVGAVEAALIAGLTSTGVALTPALTAVLAFRAVTFWLPAPIGWGAFVLLQRRAWV